MIIPREVLVRPGIIDSERVCALPVPCQLFFRNLLHACDGAGRFIADVDELRCAFYRRAPGVSNPHVEAWLTKCHQAHLVKLYTRGGKGYGEVYNYGQRDKKRRVLYPPPDDGELNFAAGTEPAADPPPKPKLNGMEGKGNAPRYARRTPAPDAAQQATEDQESQSAWTARLEQLHPGVDVVAELRAAARNRRLQNKRLERGWFETHWLGNLSTEVQLGTAPAGGRKTAIEPEPEAWGVWLETEYPNNAYGKGGAKEGTAWADLPADVRAKIAREMKP